jgi:HK97 family phage portal protein
VRSAIARLRNAASAQPPVPIAPYGYTGGMRFQLGTGTQSKEAQLRTYGMSGTVFSIVSLLQSATAFPKWHLYKKQPADGRRRYAASDVGDDQRVEIVSHAALTLWNNPNSFMSGFEFREGSNQHFELAGETFWVLDRSSATALPLSMWYVRPDRMSPVPDANGYLAGWVYSAFTGEQIPLELWQVIQEKTPDPLDPFRGASPIASIMANIQQQHYATDYQRNLFLNGAQPDGIISFPNKVEDTDFDEFTARWRESHMGVSNAGRVGILEMGATWTAGSQSNRDLEYGQLRLANRDEIREAFRMHKALLGTVEDVNRANAQTAEETFSSQLQLPRLERRKYTLNDKLLPMFGSTGANAEFDYEDPSPVNAEGAISEMAAKATAAQVLVSAGYDPSDVLEAVGLPDMDVVEKATQAPVAPPGWVVETPAAPAGPTALPTAETVNLIRLRAERVSPMVWNWVTEDDDKVCQACKDMAAGGPYGPTQDKPPLHPNCECHASYAGRQENRAASLRDFDDVASYMKRLIGLNGHDYAGSNR